MTKLMITQDEHNGRILLPCRKNKNKTCWPGGRLNGTRTKEWHNPPKKKRIKED
jgi:hypothetical protein